METGNVFSNYVNVSRPNPPKPIHVPPVADGGDVIDEGIEPNVHHVPGLDRKGNAPVEGGPGNADVFQAGIEKAQDFVPADVRQDPNPTLLDRLADRLGVAGEGEEVIVLFERPGVRAVLRADSAGQVLFPIEGLAGVTI